MEYIYLLCLTIIILCTGSARAFRAIKERKINREPLDKSFIVHFITGIPTFIITLYYILFKPDGLSLMLGVIVFSGILAVLYGIYYDRNKH